MTAALAWPDPLAFPRLDRTATRAVARLAPFAPAADTSFSTGARSGAVSAADWRRAFTQLAELQQLSPNWDSYGGVVPLPATVAYANAELSRLMAADLPAPEISPSPDGRILATWSGQSIEVELWFEAPYQEMALIEDRTGEVEEVAGPDPLLVSVSCALRKLQTRSCPRG